MGDCCGNSPITRVTGVAWRGDTRRTSDLDTRAGDPREHPCHAVEAAERHVPWIGDQDKCLGEQ